MLERDLIVVGAGAKAAAIAAKVHALNSLGIARITATIVEAAEPAASWSGRNGMTTGEEPLAIPPIKDVGFPYQSSDTFGDAGAAIDGELLAFSWQRHLIERHGYARWVNAGSPQIQHGDYGRYLAWVFSRATDGVELVTGRVAQVSLAGLPERWQVRVLGGRRRSHYNAGAIVLTGPGVHRLLPHDARAAPMLLHCDSDRADFARIPASEPINIAIVGGGESALSSLAFLRMFRPEAGITVYTSGLPMSRGESFLENRVFSDPDAVAWRSLDLKTRRDFVKHCDRGVFDPPTLGRIAYDERCRFVVGRASHVAAAEGGRRALLHYLTAGGPACCEHDYVVNCTGFDLLEQLRDLFPPPVRAVIERRAGALWSAPPGSEVAIGRQLELEHMRPLLHIPGLAALTQGPGFANLGCLGLLADRVLAPFVLDRVEGTTVKASQSQAAP